MPKSSQTNVDSEVDLDLVKSLIREKQLDATLAKLDSADILGTIKKVPHGVIRLLTHLLLTTAVDEQVNSLPQGLQKVVSSLLKSARKHDADKFVETMVREAQKDSQIESLLGIDLAASKTNKNEKEAGIANTITSLFVAPHLMLQTSRLYCRVGFYRGEKLLFRSDIELAGMISLARSLLESADETLAAVSVAAPGSTANVNVKLCEDTLRSIRSKCVKIKNALTVVTNSEKKPKASKKKPRRKKRTR